MSSERRRWLWIAIVAVVAAAMWWLVPGRTSPSQAPAIPEPPELPSVSEKSAPVEAPTRDGDAPSAAPLPRDEVELPVTDRTLDAGVPSEDSVLPEQKRDRMMMMVIDRLKEDRSAATEAGDEERAAQLEVRIERLEQRRDELAGQ